MPDPSVVVRSSLGGYPILPVSEAWPVCGDAGCRRKMSLFLQIDIEPSFGLSVPAGSVLSIFQCIAHDDPLEPVDLIAPKNEEALAPDYWNRTYSALFLAAPDRQLQLAEREPHVEYAGLASQRESEPPARSAEALNFKNIKVGGVPFWVQKPRQWRCSCGAKMSFLCSVPENTFFPCVAGSPAQPGGRAGRYFLFLGLSIYVFACSARCHPRALIPILQN